jgi:hypothetical protein
MDPLEGGRVDTPFWDHGTSATGRLAPRYPGAYTAGTVADAVRPSLRAVLMRALG